MTIARRSERIGNSRGEIAPLGESRLLWEIEYCAREAGVSFIHLEMNWALREAIGLHRRSDYREVPAFKDGPYAQHWFEKTL